MQMKKHMSRRSFIGLTSALVAASAAGLVGCAGGSSSGSASASAVSASGAASEPSAAASVSASSAGTAAAASASSSAAAHAAGKSIIVLWSWSGNTLKVAERLSELSGAEIYRIEAADPYPQDYDATADRAKQEQDDGIYPEIANPIGNWADYDTIFIGYPIWWYQLPMIVQGFVNDHDWAGKTIVPFNTHEGSGNGGTYDDLRDMTGATVLEGLAIRGGDVDSSLDRVDAWYEGLGL